jgi:hypothetical protein
MYNIPYAVESVEELKRMTRLADFYRALPIVSASLYRAIWGNSALGESIWSQPFAALQIAKKLRHPILFREALIHVVRGREEWEGMGNKQPFEDDDELNNIAFRAHSQFCVLKLEADHEILSQLHWNSNFPKIFKKLSLPESPQQGADYYRQLLKVLKAEADKQVYDDVIEAIDGLLINNLALVKDIPEEAYDHFFCADIEDKDMPWDPTQTEW